MKKYFAVTIFFTSLLFNAQKGHCYDLDKVLKVEPTPLYEKHLNASKKFNIKILKDSKTVKKIP